MPTVDFLTPRAQQIRHQIFNIIESYNHDWDILAELAQNAVDAITAAQPVKGHLKLSIDAAERSIVFEDNGCGIDPGELPKLLAPFSSGKLGNPSMIGQKGVGVSFVIFSSAFFEVESHHVEGSSRAKIEGAWAWVDAQTEKLPQLQIDPIEPIGGTGTKIVLRLPAESDYEFFRLTFRQLDMVLRTRTALGDTNTIWGGKVNKDLVLTFKVGSSRVDLQACKLEYSIVSPK